MVIGIIDIIVLITLVLSILFALYRGLICELLCISSWILAGIAGLYSFALMKTMLYSVFNGNELMAGLVGSSVIALVVLVVMTLLSAQVIKRLRASSLSGLDRIFGLLFGGIRAVLLLSLVYIGASMVLPATRLQSWEETNFSMPYIKKSVDMLKYIVPETVLADLNVNKDEDSTEEQPKIGTDLKRKQQPNDTTKKALDNLVKEVKTPSKLKPIEVKKEEPVKQEIVDYQDAQRESLDIMVEAIAGE